jgi:hypothetical protein
MTNRTNSNSEIYFNSSANDYDDNNDNELFYKMGPR